MSRELPILFSGPMVRAILDGRKTKTRRVITLPRNPRGRRLPYPPHEIEEDGKLFYEDGYGDCHPIEKLARYKVGDLLWVRETWGTQSAWSQYKPRDIPNGVNIYFRADYTEDWSPSGWRPSIFMPKWASRISLRMTDIRVERVQNISEEDAKAEGISYSDSLRHGLGSYGVAFSHLWDSINGKRGYGWEKNPWVWVYTFERTEGGAK